MRKRIYSILLAIAMLATIIPITVLAEDPPHTHDGYTAISNATELATLFTNGGSGYLTADIATNSDASRLIKAGKTVNLCLNGFVLTLGYNNGQNIGIEGNGVLNLYDCGTKTHKFSVGANGLWTLDETSGTETVTGGVITGGKGGSGIAGAVYMASGANFNMYGGNIVGNQASGKCGAVYVDGTSVFNMTGGNIIGNQAQYGGGIYVANGATVDITGGTIENNQASQAGGAVQVDGTFRMSGGTIKNNHSDNDGGGLSVNSNIGNVKLTGTAAILNNTAKNLGGGVSYYNGVSGKVILGGSVQITGNKGGCNNTDGTIQNVYLFSGNNIINIGTGTDAPTSDMQVGITMASPGKFTTNGTADDVDYFTSDASNYYVRFVADGNYLEMAKGTPVAQIGNAKYLTLKDAIKAAGVVEKITDTNAKTIKLLANITNEGVFTIGPEETLQNIILDLNGFTISDTTATTSLFTIVGHSKLTIDDSSEGKTGAITAKDNTTSYLRGFDVARGTLILNNGKISDFNLKGSNSWQGAGVSIWRNTGTFIMNGGEISNCTAEIGGGVDNDGTFVMNGGTITGNTASKNGGGINNSFSFTMTGGTITGNTAGTFGGGMKCEGTFTMEGGSISKNTASLGGGLDVSGTLNMTNGSIDNNTATNLGGGVNANGTFNMYGGEITNNKATNHSGGVCFNNKTATLGGTAKITNNFVGDTPNNFQLMNEKVIIIGTEDYAPKSGMSVGVTMQTPGQFTTTSATSGDGQYFTSDDKAYAVAYKPDGFLKLELTYTVTFNTDGGSAIDAQEVEVGGVVTQPTNPTKEGYTFFRWLDKDGKPFDFSTPITEDITLKASWLVDTYSVKFYKCVGDETPFCFYNVSYNNTIGNAPNPTRKDYIFKGWYYNGKPFDFNTKVTCDMDVYAEWEAIAHDYKITEGAHALWLPRYEKGFLSFRSNADYSKFVSVEVDNKILDASKFIASPGSTIVKLKPEYLSTLAIGKHTLRIVSTDGYAETDFYIEDETIAPTDGGFLSEATMSTAFVGMGVVGLSAVFYVGKKKKLRK